MPRLEGSQVGVLDLFRQSSFYGLLLPSYASTAGETTLAYTSTNWTGASTTSPPAPPRMSGALFERPAELRVVSGHEVKLIDHSLGQEPFRSPT